MGASCVSIVVADCRPFVLLGLKSVLDAESDFKVVGTCHDGKTCLDIIREQAPDLALLDVALPPVNGLQVLAAINAEHLHTRVVFLSSSLESSASATATAEAAYGVVPQDATPTLLLRCLREVASGQKLVPTLGHKNGSAYNFGTLSTVLTERERQIVCLVGEGLSNKEVGRRLDLSDGTVKVHLHRVYQKLVIRNRTALALLAERDKISNP